MSLSSVFARTFHLGIRRSTRVEKNILKSYRHRHGDLQGVQFRHPTFRRNFFGIGEVLGILANPGETLRSLADSKRLLEETRAEMLEQKERAQIPPKHTFSPLPGFYHREKEIKVIETSLSSVPNFTVIFGGTSVGKTALLRQVLTHERYHVIHFDLRIAGFADLSSLFFSLSSQMEQFFVNLASRLEGYDTFETEALAFKHTRLDVERRLEKSGARVKTSDIAHLLELFQSSLLKYWEFTPKDPDEPENLHDSTQKPIKEWEKAKLEKAKRILSKTDIDVLAKEEDEEKLPKPKGLEESRSVQEPTKEIEGSNSHKAFEPLHKPENKEENQEERWKPPTKKIPVFFLDEAHKLPDLISDAGTMKCILNGLLVLTKQDRLCHVIHATSDPFYMYWLREMNVLAHCTIITIGDPTKAEAQRYYNENLMSTLEKKLDQVPVYDGRDDKEGDLVLKREPVTRQTQRSSDGYELDFETVYKTFGGKLAHLQGFVGDYLNSGGTLKPEESSQFLQAYALLHYHLINCEQKLDQLVGAQQSLRQEDLAVSPSFGSSQIRGASLSPQTTSVVYPMHLTMDHQSSLKASSHDTDVDRPLSFSSNDLLYVMQRLTKPDMEPESDPANNYPDFRPPPPSPSEPITRTLPYFGLCREIGVRAVDQMIRSRILDLRWTPSVTSDVGMYSQGRSEVEPVVLPTSPVMRCAMKKVVDEYLVPSTH